ncbi:putative F-box protein [Raphanus sativus]|uniref:F-box protein n=1 Tax=Raphanus sativus TaxID=3726 RepID=A0A6J0JXV1_RAPSA|nr:probable F-box protein At5g04010 [Raphanus sativus]KAJ4890711.1 putative F-box protein [Raphanus sativus]
MSPSASVVVARVLSSPAAMRQNPLKRKRDEDEITVHEEYDVNEHAKPRPPSWEALCVLGPYMDPETLAVASCVSTTWLECFSSEDLWKSLLTARSAQRSSPYEMMVLKNAESISCKHLVSAVETDAKRRRKDQVAEPVKISLSDLSFMVHVSTKTKKASVYKKGKDLEFGPNDKFKIEADVSKAAITAGEDDVRMTWQVMYKEKFFTIADTTRALDTKNGWFTDRLEDKCNRKLVGDVKPSFNGEVLEKIGFSIVDSDGWGSLLLDGFLRYLQRFLLE